MNLELYFIINILENSINEIKNAIAELQAENIKVTQANVIRRLKGKRSKKTIIHIGKLYFQSKHRKKQFLIGEISPTKNHYTNGQIQN